MKSGSLTRLLLAVYITLFFLFMLGPLVVMAVSSVNTPTYPQAWPVEGLTLGWFTKLFANEDMREGLRTSFVIGVLVVMISVPIGLAGAIVMTQISKRARSFYYLIVVSPVLTPGIIIGISTIIFWRDFTAMTGTRGLYNGIFLTVMGQSSFISAYCMLIILARLQRFDRTLEEAALDLGASFTQVFQHITLPFLRPALLSSAVLAFLSSFENYNTTTFAILSGKTMTTVLAGDVRQGSDPTISALATIIVAITVFAAVTYEVIKRREDRRIAARRAVAFKAETLELAGEPARA